MSKLPHDINDDEIRIISSERKMPVNQSHYPQEKKDGYTRLRWNKWMIIGAIFLIGALTVFFWWEVKDDPEEPETLDIVSETNKQALIDNESMDTASITGPMNAITEKGYVETYDTTINKVPLSIFIPKSSVPKLHVGVDALKDTTAVFMVQAADVRKDNGLIVGTYVSEGNLISKGQSKAGFCAIINGKMTIGIATATPYLEQAIESGGYFFRQYPLVVGRQVVDNKLKSSSLRKALAEFNGELVVIISGKKQTLNEFSQTLVDLGVTNAIYLIGSTAPGFAIDKDGNRIEFGKEYENPPVNSNYIIWQ